MTSKTEIEYDLQKTSDILILNETLTESPGLIHGKTGIAIFFFPLFTIHKKHVICRLCYGYNL